MKKLVLFLSMACTIAFVSCSDDDSESATSITLSADQTTADVGSTFTFTVEDDLGNDVTSSSTLYVDGESISGSTYTPTEAATYEVTAIYGSLTSESIEITAGATEAPTDGVLANGETFTVDASIAAYLGPDDDSTYNTWVIAAYNSSTGEEVDIYLAIDIDDDFISEGDFEYTSYLPATYGAFLYYGDYADSGLGVYSGGDIEPSTIDLTIEDLTSDASYSSGTWSISFEITSASGDEFSGNFTGDWSYYDASSSRPADAATPAFRDLDFQVNQ